MGIEFIRNNINLVAEEYLSGISIEQLNKKYKARREYIKKELVNFGIKIRNKSETNRLVKGGIINHDCFGNFSEAEQRYWYGFILADGHINEKTKNVSLLLKSTDSLHLVKFLEFIGSKREPRFSSIYDKRTHKTYDRVSTSVNSEIIFNTLYQKGLRSGKSTRETLPLFETDLHFWRGVLDGDGHIGSKQKVVVLVGSEEICQGFIDFCNKNNLLKTQRKISAQKSIYRVCITGEDAIRVSSFIYQDNYSELSLYRKFKQAKDMSNGIHRDPKS